MLTISVSSNVLRMLRVEEQHIRVWRRFLLSFASALPLAMVRVVAHAGLSEHDARLTNSDHVELLLEPKWLQRHIL